jgi:hypothetical protein
VIHAEEQMAHRRLHRPVLAALLQLTIVSTASAECELPPPLCESFWSHDVVFDGTVTAVEPIEREGEVYELSPQGFQAVRKLVPYSLVTYQVNEAWRGVTAREVQSEQEGRGTRIGSRWLIVGARTGTGMVSPFWCNQSVEYRDAATQLEFLHSEAKPAAGGRVYGDVYLRDGGFFGDVSPSPKVQGRS